MCVCFFFFIFFFWGGGGGFPDPQTNSPLDPRMTYNWVSLSLFFFFSGGGGGGGFDHVKLNAGISKFRL